MKNKFANVLIAGLSTVLATTAVANGNVEKVEGSFPVHAISEGKAGGILKDVPALTENEVAEYEIRKSEKMRSAMDRWTRMVGYTLVWQPEPEDGDIEFAASMTFRDTFKESTKQFFEIVKSQSKFDAQLHDNGVLRVFIANQNR
jgi:hypothetical protein